MITKYVCKVRTDVTLGVTRWVIRLWGWHCLTVYRYEMSHPRLEGQSVTWWLYIGENVGFGVHLPWFGD